MKTERRHELQTNELADWLGKGVEMVEQNARAAVGVLVVLAVILVVFFFVRSDSASKRVKGWDRYFQAINGRDPNEMLAVAETYPNTAVGAWARLWVADNQLISGVNQLFQNRAEANDQLRRALANYQDITDSSIAGKEPLLNQRALWGLARAYESLNDLEKARAIYAQLTDTNRWEHPLFATDADHRLKNLEQQSTKQFYDWFAKYEPTPPTSEVSPSGLNLEKLPAEPSAESAPDSASAAGAAQEKQTADAQPRSEANGSAASEPAGSEPTTPDNPTSPRPEAPAPAATP